MRMALQSTSSISPDQSFAAPDLDATGLALRTSRRIARRLLPFLFLLYVIAFLDRMNVGAAALQMPHDLGLSDRAVGLGAGIFFLGYFLLEIPGALIAERWSARRWIARIMISWGILTFLLAFIHSTRQFYVVRLEGVPAVLLGLITLVYLTDWPQEAQWLKPEERDWIICALKQEKESKQKVRSYTIWQALRHRDVILLTTCYFFAVTGNYGIGFWLPSFLKRLSGESDIKVTLLAALP